MRKFGLLGVAVVLIVAAVVAYGSLYTVHQTQQALVLQFGNPVGVVREPGLKVKLPFIQDVVYYERRILDLDPPVQQVLLADQKRINVDSFARYRIVDPLEFRKRAQTTTNFRQIMGDRLNSAVRAEVAKVSLADMLSSRRAEVMNTIARLLTDQVNEFGVEFIDLRIGRTDLPDETLQAVYNRMRSDRVAQAAQLRAEGEEQKLRIQADADRQRTVIIAEANRQASVLRGEGEGQRNKVLGDAFGQDVAFFDFYRSMEAYGEALGDGTTMVLSPDSEFFRYFGSTPGKDIPSEQSGR